MVNIKSIVIGLMDRLSAYAARESASESKEEQQAREADNLSKLLNNIQISHSSSVKPSESHQNGNGESTETDDSSATASTTSTDPQFTPSETETEVTTKGAIPEDIQLFEIFYEQVMTLTKLHQRLQVWDTMALLVSLTNLAL